MGKKGSWLSAIKKVFTSNSKEKPVNEVEKKSSKEKKKGRGKLKHGESRSFIPLFREPSSIEKILGEVDQQKLFIGHPTPIDQPNAQPSFSRRRTSPKAASPRAASPRVTSPRAASPRVTSPRAASPRVHSPRAASGRGLSPRVVDRHAETRRRPEPTLRQLHLSATTIQAAFRGYMARRSFKALRGLVRLQGVVRGQNVKRQTVNAMKQMQLLVRIQTQIQSRRIQMLENQTLEHQTHKNDKEVESLVGKWTLNNVLEGDEHWDDSLITKEEKEARMQKKMEAVIKRERAMAYAYSHQLWKATPKSAQNALMDIRSGGSPWWWNWLERQIPSENETKNTPQPAPTPTPPRSNLGPKASPLPSHNQKDFTFDNLDTPTPRSSRSMVPARSRQQQMTPTRTPPSIIKHLKPRGSGSPYPLKDDDSLMSCPPFSVPNYMSPTVSAKAKARPNSNPKDRFPRTPGSETSKRRFSFPLAQNMGSFKWNKGSSSKESTGTSRGVVDKHKSPRSIGDLSVDSTISMPATVGRKPFNRFV